MASDVSDTLRQQVAERAYHACEYCLIHEDDTSWVCQVDYIISRKHGGVSENSNLAWTCAAYNNSKGSDLGTITGPRALNSHDCSIPAQIVGPSPFNCTALA